MEKYLAPIQIDIDAILRGRLSPRAARRLPRRLTSLLARVVRQDELNAILRAAFPADGSEFAAAALRELDVTVEVRGLDRLPGGRRYVFACNHPLGGLDGIAVIMALGRRYGDDNVRVLVNDMLMNIRPMSRVFLPVNKYGAQGRKAARDIDEAYASDMQLCMFPAGLVSRIGSGGIRDLEWQKAFVVKALRHGRDIVPMHFEGLNTPRFYRTALWRKRLGLKFNIEQALLPSELCRARGSRYVIRVGEPVTHAELTAMTQPPHNLSPLQIAARLRDLAYSLPAAESGSESL